MANPETNEDSIFERTCLRYGLPIERGIYVAQNELSGWSSDELSAIFDKIDGLPAALDTVRRPYPWQAQHWVKPASALVERAANEQLALCVNTRGDWQLKENDYVALSHVWDEGLYADPGNRGLPRSIIKQLFAMLQPLNAKWLWLDSLAVPGGRRDLTLNEELVKTKLINNMNNVYRNAKYVVILDSLLLRLQSQDPVDVGVTLLFGQWVSRVWTYQEVKQASCARILTKAGFVDLRCIIERLGKQDGAKILRLYESLKRVLNPNTSRTSILDIALSSANRSTSRDIDYCRGFYPCLGLNWNTRFSRDRGMQYIMESRKEEAPLLLGLHGSPLLIEGYAWAPANLCGLSGTPLLNLSWEQSGLRREWYSYRVTSNEERQLPESVRRGGLLLGVAAPEGIVSCACELSRRERPEAVIGFKMAIENQSAFLLSELSLEALSKDQRPGPPPTVLLVRQASTDNEAFIYMTAALLRPIGGVPASPQEWLIYHRSPLLDAKSSDNRATPATLIKGNNQLPHDGETQLHTAARLSDVAEVHRIISLPCNIDAEDAAGWTPLHIASYLNHLQVVQMLLEGEASVRHIGRYDGLAALHLAIMARNTECVKALLEARADANLLTSSKLTPLMLAAELGLPDAVQQLIHAGARVDFACQPGMGTPLHAAVQSNSIAVLKLLLEGPGARRMLYWRDANGSSAGWLALKKADYDAQNVLAREMGFFRLLGSILTAVQVLAYLAFVLLLLGLPISLALDFGLLLIVRVDMALGHCLSSLWSRYETPVAWTLYLIVCFFTRRRRTLMPKLWALFLIVRSQPFERLGQAVEAESFRWSTDTLFFSRLLVIAIPLLEAGWLVIKKPGPFICCALTTGGLFRYFRQIILGRSSSQSLRTMERGKGQIEPFVTFFLIGAVLNLIIAMVFYLVLYLCRLVGLLFGLTGRRVFLRVTIFTCISVLNTLRLRQFYLGEFRQGFLRMKMSRPLFVQQTLWLGAFQWLKVVLLRSLWQGSFLPGEILLGGGMTGVSKMQISVHRLVLWVTFGRLHAVFSRPGVMRARLLRQEIQREGNMGWVARVRLLVQDFEHGENMGWVAFLFRDALMGVWIYCPIVATLTVCKILWDWVSTGSWVTGLSEVVSLTLTRS